MKKFTEFIDVLPIFCTKMAENGPGGTRKSGRISESTIAMEIGLFLVNSPESYAALAVFR